jgi:hypothetical protein
MPVSPVDFVPSGWPIAEQELLLGYVGTVLVVRFGGSLSASGFARYIEEWKRGIDARPADAAVFAMYDLPDWPGLTAAQRKQWGDTLKSREEVLRQTTRGVVIATPSPVTRGGVQAVFGIAPPPFPHVVVPTPRAAFAHIAGRGGPPEEDAAEAYEALIRDHWRTADA